MEKLEKLIDKYWFLIVVVLTLPSVWALLVPGFYGASDDLHVAWLFEMDRAIKAGQFPPRFVPDLSYGFGYPLFNFVFPLPYYIGEIFHLLSLNFVDSVKALFFISLSLSGLSMFKMLRNFTSPLLSLAGAMVYVFTPYRSNDVYNRGDLGEALTFVVLPLIILCFCKIVSEKKKLRWISLGGLSLAALVLTHDITAYMFFPAAFLFVLFLVFFQAEKRIKSFILLSASAILGLLVSVYFWLPAILDSGLMKYDTVFNFIDHFPTLQQLITPYWGYGASVPGPGDGMSFYMGTMNWVLLVGGIILSVLFWKRLNKFKKGILIWALVTFLIAFFMMNFRSAFLWGRLPLLPYFQFPWRFLILTTFITPIFVVVLEEVKYSKYLALGILVFAVGLNWSFFRPHDFLGRTDSYYLNRYIPYPSASEAYKQTQEEYLRLPKDTQQRPDKNYPIVFPEVGVSNLQTPTALSANFQTNSQTPLTLSFNKYFFPGWEVLVDGKSGQLSPGQPFGQVTFEVPQGQHSVSISFKETALKLFLDIISLLSLIAALVFLVPLRYDQIDD